MKEFAKNIHNIDWKKITHSQAVSLLSKLKKLELIQIEELKLLMKLEDLLESKIKTL